MAKRNIIVLGGSSGSFEVFRTIAAGLPEDLDAAVFIVWHMSPNISGVLSRVLNSAGPLPASEPVNGELFEYGHIYVARPDHHMLIDEKTIRITRGPKENRFRPAVDPLFRSAAFSHGPRTVGIITSGALDDGSSGLWEIKRRGGVAVVQDPLDAEIASMPENAMREIQVNHIVPAKDIARLIVKLTTEEIGENAEVFMQNEADNERTRDEIRIAAEDSAFKSSVFAGGELSPLTCPDCSGVLARITDGGRFRFRCHTGHAFSADSLLSALTENIEHSLWSAIRGVEESIMLLNHLGDHFAEINKGRLPARFFQKAKEAESRNERIRKVVLEHELLTTEAVGMPADELALDK